MSATQEEPKSQALELRAGPAALLLAIAAVALGVVGLVSWRDGHPSYLAHGGSAAAGLGAVVAGLFGLTRPGPVARARLAVALAVGLVVAAFWLWLYASLLLLGTE